jgi:hypothetical protein
MFGYKGKKSMHGRLNRDKRKLVGKKNIAKLNLKPKNVEELNVINLCYLSSYSKIV